jgi:hypothetical protein
LGYKYALSPEVCGSKFFCLSTFFAFSVPTVKNFALQLGYFTTYFSNHICDDKDMEINIDNVESVDMTSYRW